MSKSIITAVCATLLFTAAIPLAARNSRQRITPSNTMVTRTVSISKIDEITASRVKVIYTPERATGSVRVTAPDNLISYVQVTSNNGVLKCEIDNDIEVRGENGPCVTIEVSSYKVHEFEAILSAVIDIRDDLDLPEFSAETSTSGTIKAQNITVSDEIELDATTSGSIKVRQASARKLTAEASTSGSVKVASVTVRKLDVEATTSGSVKIEGGTAETADCDASTSGSVNITEVTAPRGTLDASTSGSIRANVPNASISTSTGGSVRNHR